MSGGSAARLQAVHKTSKRRLIEIAVSGYGADKPDENQVVFRRGIAAQVAVVEGWWASESLGDDRCFTLAAPEKLNTVRELRHFLDKQALEDAEDDDAIVIYVTGHGKSPSPGQHFLLLPDSVESRLLSTAFPTVDLITMVLDSLATHVLVMIDSCFSGALGGDLNRRLRALSYGRSSLKSLIVMSSANDGEEPRLEGFSRLLAAVVEHCKAEETGFARSHLSFHEFFTTMTALSEESVSPDVQVLWPRQSTVGDRDHLQPSPCFPNPGYRPQIPLVGSARSDVAWTRAEFDTYWLSRASGQPAQGRAGWYFTGRSDVTRRISEFLEGDSGTLIVTGQAGSGKSALLARVVTLSDPLFRSGDTYGPFIDAIPRDSLVPVGSVDAAILARNMDVDELVASLYTTLHAAFTDDPPPVVRGSEALDSLLELVLVMARRSHKPLTVVVDGIDEAKDPARVITALLCPLSEQRTDDEEPAVRLLLGIRSAQDSGGRSGTSQDRPPDLLSLLIRSTSAGEPVRTDEGTAEDIAAYARALLEALFDAPDGTAHPGPERLNALAAAVAEEVAPSFLDARIAAERLHAQSLLPAPDDPDWRRTLRGGTWELMRQDLDEVVRNSGQPAPHVINALRATALAQGSGLPWRGIWPAAANGLSRGGIRMPEALIRKVWESRLSGYLMKGVEDGRVVYRPIHESISEMLRNAPYLLLDDRAAPDVNDETAEADLSGAHRRLAEAFAALQAGQDDRPQSYVCRHLVQHAAAGGVLNDRTIPDKFLVWESSGNVHGTLGLLSEHAADTERLFAWARIEPFLANASTVARADSLTFSAWKPGASALAAASRPRSGSGGHFVPRWNGLAVRGNILARSTADIHSLVSFTVPDGAPLIAVGDADGKVRVWDPSTGTPAGTPVLGPGPFARAMAIVSGPHGGPLVAVGCDSGVWTCDPQTGHRTQLPVTGQVRDLASFVGPDGAERLAVGTSDGLVLCDALTGAILPGPAREGGMAGPVTALSALAVPGEVRTLLAVRRVGEVEVMDANSFDPVCTVPDVGEEGFSALTLFAGRHGRPGLAVAARESGKVRIWDVLTGEERRHSEIRRSVAVLAPYQRPGAGNLLVAGGVNGSVQLWDPETGEEFCRFPTDHVESVTALAVVPGHAGIPVVVSGSLDRTVRVRNPESGAQRTAWSFRPADGTLLATLSEASGSTGLLTLGPGGTLTMRSADSGDIVRSVDLPGMGGGGPVTALATHTAPDGSVTVVVGLADGTVCCRTDAWYLTETASPGGHATVFAVFSGGPWTILATGMSDGTVVYCDLATGAAIGTLHPRSGGAAGGPVHALVHLALPSGGVLAVASADGVRLCRPLRDPHAELPGGIGVVRSLAALRRGAEDDWSLVTGGADGTVRLWSPDAPEKEVLALTGHDGPVSALGIVRSSTAPPLIVSTGADDTTVRIWDFRTGEEVLRLVTGAPLTSLSVLPPGDRTSAAEPIVAFGGPAGVAAAAVSLPQPADALGTQDLRR